MADVVEFVQRHLECCNRAQLKHRGQVTYGSKNGNVVRSRPAATLQALGLRFVIALLCLQGSTIWSRLLETTSCAAYSCSHCYRKQFTSQRDLVVNIPTFSSMNSRVCRSLDDGLREWLMSNDSKLECLCKRSVAVSVACMTGILARHVTFQCYSTFCKGTCEGANTPATVKCTRQCVVVGSLGSPHSECGRPPMFSSSP